MLAIKREHLGDAHTEVAISLVALGGQLRDQGRFDESRTLLEEALEIRRQGLVAGHPSTGRAMLALAETLALAGNSDDCAPLARDGVGVLEVAYPETHPALEQGREVLAVCLGAGPP